MPPRAPDPAGGRSARSPVDQMRAMKQFTGAEIGSYVAMPYGVKDGIDFNLVYADLIKPALESAGLEVFRADEELRAGDIRTDMFQELLLADLVVVDLSIDNPNVWCELGVRHALRPRGVIQIQGKRDLRHSTCT